MFYLTKKHINVKLVESSKERVSKRLYRVDKYNQKIGKLIYRVDKLKNEFGKIQ